MAGMRIGDVLNMANSETVFKIFSGQQLLASGKCFEGEIIKYREKKARRVDLDMETNIWLVFLDTGEERRMTDQDVVRYLELVNRRLKLSMSGVNWKPEYEQELEEIEKELAELIPLAEYERERTRRK